MLSFYELKYSDDGKRLFAGGIGSESMNIWSTDGYDKLLTLPTGSGGFQGIRMSKDGRTLGALGRDCVYLWHAPTFDELAASEAKERIQSK